MSSVVRSVVAAAIAAAVIERGGTAQQPPSPGTWVTAWASSPQALGTKTISNATVRMIGRATLAGSAVRVRIDNTFGPAPLAVGAAYVGEPLTTRSGDSASRGAALVAGSNRQLKFGGAAGVVVPQGGSVVSDGVSMAVAAHQDLAVSLYIAEAGVRPTQHTSAQVRSYLTANDAGNAAAAESKSLFTQSTSSLFWLSGIDVLAPAATAGAIVAFGDSITDGTCSSFDGHDRWLDWLAARLDAAGDAKAVVNAGIGSDTVTGVSGFSVPPGVVRLERDVLTLSGVSHVILLMGINDIRLGATAAKIEAGMADIIGRVHSSGARIFGGTLLPRQDFPSQGTWSVAKNTIRGQVNSWIRSQAPFDAVIDLDAVVRDPAAPDRYFPAYNCDSVHPNPRGYYRMGLSLNLDLFEP